MEAPVVAPEDFKRDLAKRLQNHFAFRADAIGIEELATGRCAWPLGESGTEEFGYCGAATSNGRTYCAHHHGVAYRKPA